MTFFDNLKDKAKDLAQTGVSKSKQLSEIARLNLNNVAEEDAIKKAYIEIGKLYYAERGMAPEAAYTALCQKITAAKVNIEENKSRIEAIKAEDNITDGEIASVVVVENLAEEPKTTGEPLFPTTEDIPPQDPPLQ